MKQREGGLGKIRDGLIVRVNPHRVPRIIGKEGSMISLIKEATGCNITVGQNGLIWIRGEGIDNKLFAKQAIDFIIENTTSEGLTEKVEGWLKDNKSKFNLIKPSKEGEN
jgi:exosome complex component RRP4